MPFKFKVGDKVKLVSNPVHSHLIGEEGVVTKLGGVATPKEGAVVTNDKFFCGDDSYGKHGVWFPDDWLELVS